MMRWWRAGRSSACRASRRASGLAATVLRPWYVLGPGHRWPYGLIPLYWIAERMPSTREGARRCGLVTLGQILTALVRAVEEPATAVRVVTVPEIRSDEWLEREMPVANGARTAAETRTRSTMQ